MNGSQLARALSNVLRQRPDLEKGFEEHLAKWVKSALMKGPTVEGLRKIQSAAGDELLSWYLACQAEKDLVALLHS
jgi:hypothetical protein